MKAHLAGGTILAAAAGAAFVALLPGLVVAEPRDAATIAERLQQYQDRFNRGEFDALARLFSEDVVYYGPLGRVFEGRAAVAQHYRDNDAAGFSDMAVEVLEIGVFDDTAYDVARYTITGPRGEPLSGYHLAILEKQDGEWIVQRTLVNAVMPQPPAE